MADSVMSLNERIRKARSKFAAMAGTYFVGVFNDNFFKQTALLMAVAAEKSSLPTLITVIFTVPFVLLAAQAGWFADRFSKRSVVIGAKVLELVAMIFGAFGFIFGNWILILIMLGVEGVQAAIFSPALNGSIPELYPAEYVITANAIIRMISTAAILIGIAAAGFVLDIKGSIGNILLNRVIVSVLVIGVSVGGVLMSFGVAKFPPAAPRAQFPWQGPLETLKFLYRTRFDPLLAIAIAANAFFWFIGSLEVLVIIQLGISQFGFSNSMTSALVVAELVGIAMGGFISVYYTKKFQWYRLMVPSVLTMGICMLLIAAVPYLGGGSFKSVCLFTVLALMGIAGGVYMIPLEAFIQVRPEPDCKGATIAAANFTAFSGILLAGAVLYLLNKLVIKPTTDFAVMGIMAVTVTALIFVFLRRAKTE